MLLPNVETFIGCESSFEEASVVLYGAPFDSTTSFRPGARFGPAAMRHESFGLETYSPYQDKDLMDISVFDSGDLELCFGSSEMALLDIEKRAKEILHAGAVETPLASSIGASSLMSAPTIFVWETVRIALRSSMKLTPPASGVPVPGNADGSRQSKSMVKYTGTCFSFNSLTVSFRPSNVNG